MSTDAQDGTDPSLDDATALREQVETLEERLSTVENRTGSGDASRKMTIIATKGSLDMAYPPLILASTADADIQLLV
jgi:hypothetical protein